MNIDTSFNITQNMDTPISQFNCGNSNSLCWDGCGDIPSSGGVNIIAGTIPVGSTTLTLTPLMAIGGALTIIPTNEIDSTPSNISVNGIGDIYPNQGPINFRQNINLQGTNPLTFPIIGEISQINISNVDVILNYVLIYS